MVLTGSWDIVTQAYMCQFLRVARFGVIDITVGHGRGSTASLTPR